MPELSLDSLRQGLTAPLGYPFDPASRMFWLFWLSAAVMALFALYLQFQRPARGGFFALVRRNLFSRKHWFNRSTATDLSLLLGNSTLRALLIIPVLGSHLLLTLWVARGLQTHLGDAPDIQLHWFTIACCYTLIFFLLEDLSRFSLHMAMHRVPFLWRFHRLHHSARRLTPLTLFRIHPVEMTLYYGRGLVVFGLVSGTFVYMFGRQLSGLDVLGVDLLGFAFNFLGANLRHSHIWLTFGPLERWLISPAQHQLHHSAAPRHRNRNFGTCLALWDRLCNTHIPAGARPRRLVFGLAVARSGSGRND